jgi:ubiquinone/menaquinone biosynthesis C-methylase UbiE
MYLGPSSSSSLRLTWRVAEVFDKPAHILEVACGTGISTRHLANTLPVGSQIFATDLNEAMLNHAESVNGSLPGVTYAQPDALDLPYETESFDAVVCQFGIMFFPDKSSGSTLEPMHTGYVKWPTRT